jgi:Tol biopolymer transport system component/serine/threonine protein kinase
MTKRVNVGDQLGAYRLERVLGQGGMGVVYLATDARLGRRVALKLLAPDLAEDEAFRERFIRESRLAASIDHPNIIPVFEAGAVDGLLFIAMRYVDGTDLKKVIQQTGPMETSRAMRLLHGVARALEAAHVRGLVHRDVKPSNIIIEASQETGGEEHVYLTDFGLTKRASSRSSFTGTGQFVGTLEYVAPEQIRGDLLDARTDLYSLGCVLYEMLTAHVPFDRDSNVALIYAHLHDQPPPVTSFRPDLPVGLDQVIETAMAKDPEQRFPTCLAMVAAARHALEEAPASGLTVATPSVAAPGDDKLERTQPSKRDLGLTGIVGTDRTAQAQTAPTSRKPESDAPSEGERTQILATEAGSGKGRRRHRMLGVAVASVIMAIVVAVPIVVFGRSTRTQARPPVRFVPGVLVLIGANGSSPHQVGAQIGTQSAPAWSPDGKQIAFVSDRGGNEDIWVMKADGSSPHDITNSPANENSPTWSSDGIRIAFVSNSSGRRHIWTMNANGSQQAALTSGTDVDGNPAWSPDGSLIVFTRAASSQTAAHLWLMRSDGSDSRELTSGGAGDFGPPAWSPDGKRIAFSRVTTTSVELFVVDADGQQLIQLTKNASSDTHPSWSPDGRKLAFVTDRDGLRRVYVMNADGTDQRAIFPLRMDEHGPAWSPVASLILFTTARPGTAVPPSTAAPFSPSSSF